MHTCTLGRDRFLAVKASYLTSGLTTRIHGNTKTLPHNSLSFEVVKNVVLFINSYAEQHAILPGSDYLCWDHFSRVRTGACLQYAVLILIVDVTYAHT